jgi:GWxTD domain-containing protein
VARRRLPVLLLAAFLAAPASRAADDPLLLSLLETKKAYREKRWDDADAALRRLLELAAAPGREAALPKILPPYHFYAAAVAWERKDEARAREELARYFEFQPEATIDPGAYSRSFCIYFDAQRTEAERRNPAPPPEAGLPDLATTLPDEAAVPLYAGDPGWSETAVSVLLTEAEKKEFAALSDDASRREWVFRFWRKFDPAPVTPGHDYRTEFYRRVRYADAHFSTEKTRGSLSDRGRVLLVLGPPSIVARNALLQSNDAMARLQVASGAGPVSPVKVEGETEIWRYRKDRVPKTLPFPELEYRFVTKRGYGEGVLQKDPLELIALQKAARLLRTGS